MPTEHEIRLVIQSAITFAYQKPNSAMGEDVYVGQHPLNPDITEAVFRALQAAGFLVAAT